MFLFLVFFYLKVAVNDMADPVEPVQARGDVDGDVQLPLEGEGCVLLGIVDKLKKVAAGHQLRDDHDRVRRGPEEQDDVGVVHLLHHMDLGLELLDILGGQDTVLLGDLHRPRLPAALALVHVPEGAAAKTVLRGVCDFRGVDVGGSFAIGHGVVELLLDLLDDIEGLLGGL